MAEERVVLDGFRYEIEEGQLWRADVGRGDPIVVLHLYDEERGVHVEAYFPKEAWPAFVADVQSGKIAVASADFLKRVGI